MRALAGGLVTLAVAAGIASAASSACNADRRPDHALQDLGHRLPRSAAHLGGRRGAQPGAGHQRAAGIAEARGGSDRPGRERRGSGRRQPHGVCSTRKRLQLSAKGLRSGETDFGNKWKCPVPASVLIRVRATFSKPVTLTQPPDASYLLIATGKISSGSLAITTKDRTPLVFASVGAKAGISVARPRCQRNRF